MTLFVYLRTKKMNHLTALLFISLFTVGLCAQKIDYDAPINTCLGAINIFQDGEFELQFSGRKSASNIYNYASLKEIGTENQIWCSYIAPYSGDLTFNAQKNEGYLQMVIFLEMNNDICGEIANGISEIKRLHLDKTMSRIGLNHKSGDGMLYMLHLNEGEKIHILFSTEDKLTDRLFLNWKFSSHLHNPWEQKIVDKRRNNFAPTLSILIRDKESKTPLQASLTIEGTREIDALYIGSDLYFNVRRNCNIILKCDVEGYFFVDRSEKITAFEDREILIELEKISQGKSIKIENLEFKAGTNEIVPSSIPKLKRLNDFLALNSHINIEIQGHVFLLGDNNFMAQRISEARAKRVTKYLIDHGIDKSRIQSVGYGNTKPIYANPKFFYEEQCNRRVEIKIK